MSTLREQAYLKLIERYSALVPDSVERLKFVQLSVRTFGGANPFLRPQRALWKLRSRAVALEALWVASPEAARGLGFADALLLRAYRHRGLLWRCAAAAPVCLLLIAVRGPMWRPRPAQETASAAAPAGPPASLAPEPAAAAASSTRNLWLVETTGSSELYSNGLRILNDFATHTGPRHYAVFRLGDGDRERQSAPEWRHEPAGIVFHTTESEVTALEPANRRLIRRRDEGLLDYVQRRKLYNFVIDRFGRAYRVVPEAEYAYHAGHSLWASAGELYLDLNQAFIAVAFEARTDQGGAGKDGEDPITPAQIYSGRLLAQMLLARSGAVERNCVSHDLVSVNPARMLIGYHTDWGGAFPYEALGLTNKYNEAIPSIAEFGFGYDAAFAEAVHGRLWPGIRLAETRLEREAAERQISADRYRRQLQQDYRRRSASQRGRL
ncbi:MAG TPA: peptidoglycan recognition family protein [Bryobacterales bacterium]|nr:peptidoglycan recognition family protein [Bryobacterales bacterium]